MESREIFKLCFVVTGGEEKIKLFLPLQTQSPVLHFTVHPILTFLPAV